LVVLKGCFGSGFLECWILLVFSGFRIRFLDCWILRRIGFFKDLGRFGSSGSWFGFSQDLWIWFFRIFWTFLVFQDWVLVFLDLDDSVFSGSRIRFFRIWMVVQDLLDFFGFSQDLVGFSGFGLFQFFGGSGLLRFVRCALIEQIYTGFWRK
jgi:hypothetical protein